MSSIWYYTYFTAEATTHLQQFNEDAYWDKLNNNFLLPSKHHYHVPYAALHLTHPLHVTLPLILGHIMPKPELEPSETITHQGSRTMCNNSSNAQCTMSQCHFLHICSFCSRDQAYHACPLNPNLQKLDTQLWMPNITLALAAALRKLPRFSCCSVPHQGI